MPGVRYGPDISDDAAWAVDRVKELQEKLRRGLKLRKKDEQRDYDRIAQFAEDAFGVSRDDFDAGRLGEMAEMARYGAANSRSNVAMSSRARFDENGNRLPPRPMTKTVAREYAERGGQPRRAGSSTRTPGGEPFLTGRTISKRFELLEARARGRVAARGLAYGSKRIQPKTVNAGNFLAELDKVGIAKAAGAPGSSFIGQRGQGKGVRVIGKGASIRPATVESVKRGERRAKQRARGAAGASRTPKGPKKPSKPRTPRK